MPVVDHEVHESVKRDVSHRYGCHSDRSSATCKDHYAQDRKYFEDGRWWYVLVGVPHVMSRLCRYDQRPNDSRCTGCEHESDTEFLKGYGL